MKGNVIHSYLLAMHSNTTNPTRMVEINVSAGVVSSWVYAPYTKTSYTVVLPTTGCGRLGSLTSSSRGRG